MRTLLTLLLFLSLNSFGQGNAKDTTANISDIRIALANISLPQASTDTNWVKSYVKKVVDSFKLTLDSVVVKKRTTTNGTAVNIDTLTVPVNSSQEVSLVVKVFNPASGEVGRCEKIITVKNVNGVVSVPYEEDLRRWKGQGQLTNCRVTVGNTGIVSVAGINATLNWESAKTKKL